MLGRKKEVEEEGARVMERYREEVSRKKKRKVAVPKVPEMPELNCPNLSHDDLDTDWLDDLVQNKADLKTLAFIADLQIALGGKPDQKWTDRQELEVQDIFTYAEALKGDSCLLDSTRAEFCEKYHHHHDEDGDDTGCYTQYSEAYPPDLTTMLRGIEAKAREEGERSDSSASSGDEESDLDETFSKPQTRKVADSAPGMLHAEKMTMIEVHKSLEQAKTVLREAIEDGKDEKNGMYVKAREVVEEF